MSQGALSLVARTQSQLLDWGDLGRWPEETDCTKAALFLLSLTGAVWRGEGKSQGFWTAVALERDRKGLPWGSQPEGPGQQQQRMGGPSSRWLLEGPSSVFCTGGGGSQPLVPMIS